jgi:hypothetical protein
MKSFATGIILAVVLFVVAAAASNEARLTRKVAAEHQRLATLHYDEDAPADQAGFFDRLPLPGGSQNDIEEHRASVNYWLARYEALKPLTGATGNQPTSDPSILYVAANAAFRASHPEAGDHKAAVERLDSVLQTYADVLRANPDLSDAAYNYEYVSRLRDVLAKGKALSRPPGLARVVESADLPTGPTLHGKPGFPPDLIPMSDFKTVSPMRFDEREEQAEPGKGKAPQRKG